IALLSFVRPVALQAQTMGAYLADRIDQAPLPMTDRVTDPQGTTYLVEFERLVLSLRNGNRFRAVVRFRRTLTSVGGSTRSLARSMPVQSMTENGTFAVTGSAIRFTPDPSADTQGLQMLDGTVESSGRIAVPFDYRNGAVSRRRILRLKHAPNNL
ncbi:MAG: hypothetical protein ACKOH8_06960, partial [Gemmatimonadota bacterium]